MRFRLRINGEQAFEATTTRSAGEPESGADWILVGGPGGLPVPPRARIELQTELVSGKLLRGVPAGFARLALVEAQAIPARRSGPESPNVVLVVMDTERFDRTTGGGSKRALTPSLERLAERGTLFSNAHATSSWTWPSTASILTGLLPEEHGVLESRQSFLASELETLAEVLQREGFATAAFSGNPLLQSSRNFDQGFQTFESTQAGVFRDSDVLVPRALEWVRETAPARFFLYLHLVDPHVPHDVPLEKLAEFGARRPGDFPAKGMNEYQALIVRGEGFSPTGVPLARDWIPPRHLRWMVDLYEAAVWTGDLWLGRLLDGLEELGLEGETVIAFTSDHGEELLDHGQLKHGPSLHPELVRVPLVLAGPGVPRGRVVEVALSNRHLASTLAALAGADGALGATDALDLARPGDLRPGPVFFSTRLGFWNGQRRQGLYGVLRDGWALHLNPAGLDWGEEPGEATPRPQARLYQRERDPQERQDRASARPDLVRELMQLVEARRAASESRAPRALDAGGVATEAMLRDIGYIDGE